MGYVKRALGITVGVAVGLFVLNFITARFAPALRSWFGLA